MPVVSYQLLLFALISAAFVISFRIAVAIGPKSNSRFLGNLNMFNIYSNSIYSIIATLCSVHAANIQIDMERSYYEIAS